MAKKIFISYRRAEPDQGVAEFLDNALSAAGFEVFRDVKTPIGARWAQEIQEALDTCDYFVILLSKQSVESDMVQQEIRTAHKHNKSNKQKPRILPVRLAYGANLPYEIATILDQLPQCSWQNQKDITTSSLLN